MTKPDNPFEFEVLSQEDTRAVKQLAHRFMECSLLANLPHHLTICAIAELLASELATIQIMNGQELNAELREELVTGVGKHVNYRLPIIYDGMQKAAQSMVIKRDLN